MSESAENPESTEETAPAELIQLICDHTLLKSMIIAIEANLSLCNESFFYLHHEVRNYPKSGHPKYLPNQIALVDMYLKDITTKIAELSKKIEHNKWIEESANEKN